MAQENTGKTSHRLRIAMLSIHSSPMGPLGTQNTGGMSVYVRELAKWLGRRGYMVDIFTYLWGRKREMALHPRVRLIHLGPSSDPNIPKEQLHTHLPSIFNALESYRQSQSLEYDLIHSHYWLSGVVGAMAQARWQCPHITMFHTLGRVKNDTAFSECDSDLRTAHEQWLVQVANHIVVPSHREMDHLVGYYYAPKTKISVIPCGVNLSLFQPLNPQAERKDLGWPLDAPVVLFVGRFAPLKGLDRLVGAVARLQPRFPDMQCMIIGGDGTRAESTRALKQLVRRLGVNDHVHLVGRVDQNELPSFYNAADLLAVPSHYESFGLVALEALACGTPVAATPVGIMDAIIRPDINGVVLANASAEDVAVGIGHILDRPLSQRPSRQAIRATVENYGWSQIETAIAETYHTLMRNHDPARETEDYVADRVFAQQATR